MPRRKLASMRVPRAGTASMLEAGVSKTSYTASTSRPTTSAGWSASSPVWASASAVGGGSASTTTTQLRRPMVMGGWPRRAARSTTGTTAPRRFITPRTKSGVRGRAVRRPTSRISRTSSIDTAMASSPTAMRSSEQFRSVGAMPAAPALVIIGLEFMGRSRQGNRSRGAADRPATASRREGRHLRARFAPELQAGGVGLHRRPRAGAGGAALAITVELEARHQLLQPRRLGRQLLGGGRQLLAGRGGLLLGAVEVVHRVGDLGHAVALLARGVGNLLHQLAGAVDAGHHALEQAARALGQLHAVAGQLADLARGGLAALGQLAHFGGHHGKALAMLAGACRLDRRVQRQQVGLVGDVVDDADLLRNALHRLGSLADHLATLLGLGGGLGGYAVGHRGALGVLLDRGADLMSEAVV